MLTQRSVVFLNALALVAIALLLAGAFMVQLVLGELPCPLCNLQRAAILALAAGPALNLCFGARPRHYALSLFAALAGAIISGRQVLLHILPGDAGYGPALFGMHFYSWVFIVFVVAIALVALVLFIGQRPDAGAPATGLAQLAVVAVLVMAVLNVISVFLQCGFNLCPDEPVRYLLLGR